MTVRSFDKKCIALEQLETALQLFREGGSAFAVITLAGAAEEILGKMVRRGGAQNALDELATGAAQMHQHLFGGEAKPQDFADRANEARNALKHLNAEKGPTLSLDPIEEALDMLNRAIENYWTLEHSLTPSMEQFELSRRSA